jgi:hypothetical protein
MKTKPLIRFPRVLRGLLLAALSLFLPRVHAQGESTNFWRNVPQGPQVHGYFEGRSPCREITSLLKVEGREACIKIKWQLLLFQDPVTHAPTTYALGGFAWRNPPKTGRWAIVKGTKADPQAVIYQLEPDQPQGFLSFLKADENILLFLDHEHKPLVGNSRFSYTLNRVAR